MEFFEQKRHEMIEQQLCARGIFDERILAAFEKVERHLFMPKPMRMHAYQDAPFPIGDGQTISQPYMVALMTLLLNPHPEMRVLEIGTGSGYQTAILAELVAEVYTVERIPALSNKAKNLLESMGYTNIHWSVHDGSAGWKQFAPYDGILAAAAAPQLPPPLFEQCAVGGRIVAPVGSAALQQLTVWKRQKDGFEQKNHGGCIFVPLIGEYGWNFPDGKG